MPLTVPTGFYLCKLRWTCVGDPEFVMCNLAVATSDDPGGIVPQYEGGANAVATKVANSWAASWPSSQLDEDWTFRGCEVSHPSNGEQGENPNIQAGAETGTASHKVPINVAVLIRKLTGHPGRRNRGRMYLPAGYLETNAFSSAGVMAPSLLARFGANMDAFQTALAAENDDGPPLWPYLVHNSEGSTEYLPTLITDFVADVKLATQRRRLR